MTSLVKRSTVKGTIAVGEKVIVERGEVQKKHNAEFMDLGVESLSPAIPQQGIDTEVEPFTFELAQAAPQTPTDNQVSPQPGHGCPQMSANDRGSLQLSLSSITEKLESLPDAVAGIKA